MINRNTYQFGSVVILGGCTVHSLAISAVSYEFPPERLVSELKSALFEMVEKNLIVWTIWPESYGNGAEVAPKNQHDLSSFSQLWETYFGKKESSRDFWQDDTTLMDLHEPTIEIQPTMALGHELDIYRRNAEH